MSQPPHHPASRSSAQFKSRQQNGRDERPAPSILPLPTSPIEVLTVSVPRAAALLGISRTLYYKLVRTHPEFPRIIKIGRASRVLVGDLRRWVELQGQLAGSPVPS